ncbi:uncharacterized protein [Cicer arietinum]|uniref:Uncharacterized protein LOC101502322 n=1 Tax=Cicer arietinum TaxID=3827 RepID=A0A1S2Z406_CICAR|nr:uncharacterized protein LOC101502322 [Cicer arietinum]XP_004514679.1 uncharacterized protein LOC101502322 [Cicer arietinum]
MEVVTLVVGKVADYMVVPIGRQAGYLIFYNRNLKELANQVKDLNGTRERIIHSVEEERRNGKEIEIDVVNWLEEVKEVIENANRLQEESLHANVKCSNFILRQQLSRKATKITKVVAQVQGKGKFDRVGYLPIIVDGVFETIDGENHETRKLFKEKVVNALKDSNSRNIGVYGLGGVGKTTLVEEVGEIAKQHKLFDDVVIAHVSKNPDFKIIQGEIADLLRLRFDEETIAGRAQRLRQRIKMEKNILIILDDVWNILDLKKVGIPSYNEHNGCKLLITCRNQDVLLQMDVPKDFTFRLELLSEIETWNLFQFMAGDVVKDVKLKDIAIQVAKKCAGLPLSLVTVARALRNKRDVQSWRDALRQLQSNDHGEMDALTYSALELSYESLENDEMKEMFLLFALMVGVDVEGFLNLVIGLNIFKHINTIDDARNRIYNILESLKATCLLLEGSSKTSGGKIEMHDFVRDVAIYIARRDKHVFIRKSPDEAKWPTHDTLKRCSQIILYGCHTHELPQTVDAPNLKLFFLNSGDRSIEIPETFFEGMTSLKVLSLTCFNFSSLPISFRSLTNLHTLILDFCILENMDAIEALTNLEILHLWKSSMIKLPSEIGRLTKLRMLYLHDSGIEVIPPNIISRLTKLEELYMGNTSINWEDVNSTNVQSKNASIAELRKLSNLTALELQIRETWMLPRDMQLMFEKLTKYKIAIGDVWEWSDIKEDGIIKTLMLKLGGTNIHLEHGIKALEHGIKALIKGVESLYLDEVEGIQNVLYQLNGEGFPMLKHLHIQNNANIKHIVDTKEMNQIHVSFLMLETLVIYNLKNLEHICHGPLASNSFESLSAIKVKNCVQLKYLFSFTMVRGLSHLSEIQVCQCNSMKEIVLRDNYSASANNHDITDQNIEFLSLRYLTLEHLETLNNFFSYELTSSRSKQKYQASDSYVSKPFFSAQVSFPNLDILKLSSLNLNKIWDDNHHSMYNLTTLIVENCGGLKYLFSDSVVGSFMNLKHLEISNCPLMEEIIAKDQETNNGSNNALKEDDFLKLEKIILKDMDNLKTIWHPQFETLKMLHVSNCKKIVVVFPSSMQKTYNKIELLEVTNCGLVEEIFELNSDEDSGVEAITNLKEVYIDGLSMLKKIWSGDPQGILSFQNLTNIQLNNCVCLEYLLPLSIATRCSDLKELHIKSCWNMKEIVAEEKESKRATLKFEFNQLSTLLLWDLCHLKGFYAGNHTLTCPSLRKIDVYNCAKLTLYKSILSTCSSQTSFRDDRFSILKQQPPFITEEVIPNLEHLRFKHEDANMILQAQHSSTLFTKLTFLGLSNYKNEEATFPYWFLQNVPTLESLTIDWSFFKKIFQDEGEGQISDTRLKTLTLNGLPKLQYICEEGSRIDPVLESLEYLHLYSCSTLTNLLPSSATLNHLTHLGITDCNGLKSLFRSPIAQSLDKLTTLKIKCCNALEEIIVGEENIVDIAFVSLEILMLECLSSLNKFCSSKCFLKFPLLEEVIVRECPRMRIFSDGNTSTPNLRKVKTAENDQERFWKGNINDTINNMFLDKVAFRQFKYLALSDYPELKNVWYGKLDENFGFSNLKSLVVEKCDFLSNVLFPSNALQVLHRLEDLEVRNCDSLEALFDVKGMKSSKEILSSQLKRLTLSSLPKLKQIWSTDPYEIMSFGNLWTVNISICQSLLYVFSLSLCKDLGNLKLLELNTCGVKEIVATEDEGSMEINFNFPQLTQMTLRLLTNLNSFYRRKHTLECPLLKALNVYRCERLRMFSLNFLDPVDHDESHNDMLFQQPLFSIEKLCYKLEDFTINATDAFRMLNAYCQENIFSKIRLLRLQCFDETPTIFLNDFHAIFPNLKTLTVRNSSFEVLFPVAKGSTVSNLNKKISKQITELWLYELENIKYIWHEELPLDHPLLQDLEGLIVWSCPSLLSLVPSSIAFTYLTYLDVDKCQEMIYLITSTTAKSLVQLTRLKITNCHKILDVVMIDGDEDDIIFEKLQHLEFTSLSCLRSFCYGKQTFIFPSLVHMIVKGCPQMKIFSSGSIVASYLREIEVEDGNMTWRGDLHTTIQQNFIQQEVPRSNMLNETIICSSHLQDGETIADEAIADEEETE